MNNVKIVLYHIVGIMIAPNTFEYIGYPTKAYALVLHNTYILLLKSLTLKLSDHAQDTPEYLFLMIHIFPNKYRKLKQNPIIFPIRIHIPILRLPL